MIKPCNCTVLIHRIQFNENQLLNRQSNPGASLFPCNARFRYDPGTSAGISGIFPKGRTRQLTNSPTHQLASSPAHQLASCGIHQLASSPTRQLAISSTHQLANSSARQLISSSARQPKGRVRLINFHAAFSALLAPFLRQSIQLPFKYHQYSSLHG